MQVVLAVITAVSLASARAEGGEKGAIAGCYELVVGGLTMPSGEQ